MHASWQAILDRGTSMIFQTKTKNPFGVVSRPKRSKKRARQMPTEAINTMPTETQELQESEEAEQERQQEVSSTTIDYNENDDDALSKYLFCFASFHAVFAPVSICMIVSALAVVYLNTDESRQAGAEAFSQTYEVFNLEDSNTKQNVLASLGNTLIIVGVVCGMTFIVVLLYKFKCMRIFYGYMIFVTTMLLGWVMFSMVILAIEKYKFRVDWFSLIFVLYNFAIVGTISIFYSRGIPNIIKQGYMVASSVCLAWQLSFFGDYTAWTLLVMLALYDLFAVLTPCGPLKKLAELMSKPGSQPIPGILYEAALPTGVQRPKSKKSTPKEENTANNEEHHHNDHDHHDHHQASTVAENKIPSDTRTSFVSAKNRHQSRRLRTKHNSQTDDSSPRSADQRKGRVPLALALLYKLTVIDEEGLLRLINPERKQYEESTESMEYTWVELRERSDQFTPKQLRTEFTVIYPSRGGRIEKKPNDVWVVYSRTGSSFREFFINENGQVRNSTNQRTDQRTDQRKGRVPLALALLYNLSVIDEEGLLRPKPKRSLFGRKQYEESTEIMEYAGDELRERSDQFTPNQLRAEFTVIYPSRGGTIERKPNDVWAAYSRTGSLLREFLIDEKGEVFPKGHVKRKKEQDSSIKLGLGDFVFYSVLVSKAALSGFTSFAICVVVILTGLLGTLVLLSVYGKALPALPISIFLGVAFFFCSRELIEPWLLSMIRTPLYV